MKIKKYIQFIKENESFIYNNIIDYTLLESNASDNDIISLCEKANILGVKSVCVLPKHVKLAKDQLKDSKVLVCTVVSFPGGENTTISKLNETQQVINDGADEVDMVLNYNLLKKNFIDGKEELLYDVTTIVEECHKHKNKENNKIVIKVIVESGLLTEEETKMATEICIDSGADFIKTSTGKVSVGAEMSKIKIMYDTIQSFGSNMKIKASGGIRTKEQIISMLPMVDRFGIGYASVDSLNHLKNDNISNY